MKIEVKQVTAYQVGDREFAVLDEAVRYALNITLEDVLLRRNVRGVVQSGVPGALSAEIAAAIYEKRDEIVGILRQVPPVARAADPA